MKIRKDEIRLSEAHPSLFLDLVPEQSVFHSPVLLNKDFDLIDGYRRYLLYPEEEIEVARIQTDNIFEAAFECNLNTRVWDETDCFLWCRWARTLNAPVQRIPIHEFDSKLFELHPDILRLLAQRSLHFRQALAIAQLPVTYHTFFAEILTAVIELNANETYRFLEMALDLKKLHEKRTLQELFELPDFQKVIQNQEQTRKQRGENLLKAMRILRYPYYHKRSEQFSSYWQQLNIGQNISVKKSLFLERGLLELTITANSPEEFRERLQKLCETGNSPLWNKIWEE